MIRESASGRRARSFSPAPGPQTSRSASGRWSPRGSCVPCPRTACCPSTPAGPQHQLAEARAGAAQHPHLRLSPVRAHAHNNVHLWGPILDNAKGLAQRALPEDRGPRREPFGTKTAHGVLEGVLRHDCEVPHQGGDEGVALVVGHKREPCCVQWGVRSSSGARSISGFEGGRARLVGARGEKQREGVGGGAARWRGGASRGGSCPALSPPPPENIGRYCVWWFAHSTL